MTPLVRVEQHDQILVVTLDRAAKRNAVNPQMTRELDAALTRLEDDDSLRVAIIAADGPVFCAGTDLADGAGEPTPLGGEYGFIRRQRSKPVIAALEGPALGGGFELVMACDFVVAAEQVTFSLPEASRGRIANAGGLFRTFDRLPRNVAMELLIAGGRLDAVRAQQLGFVNRLSTSGSVMTDAVQLADDICVSAPNSVAEVMAAVRTLGAAGEVLGWDLTAVAMAKTLHSQDRAEGNRAFFERRLPAWVRGKD